MFAGEGFFHKVRPSPRGPLKNNLYRYGKVVNARAVTFPWLTKQTVTPRGSPRRSTFPYLCMLFLEGLWGVGWISGTGQPTWTVIPGIPSRGQAGIFLGGCFRQCHQGEEWLDWLVGVLCGVNCYDLSARRRLIEVTSARWGLIRIVSARVPYRLGHIRYTHVKKLIPRV